MNTATRPFSVLLVDDDPGDVFLIEEALQSMRTPRVVYVANDGEEAVAFLRQSGRFTQAPRPDVILLDLNMPRMNGHQVLTEVKADPVLRTIPIVILTTSQAPEDVLRSYSLHANAHITKPMNLDDLVGVIHKIDDFFTRTAQLP